MKTLDRWYALKDKVIILTGATGKIGPEYAKVLSECGANLVCLDLEEEKCRQLEIREYRSKNADNP